MFARTFARAHRAASIVFPSVFQMGAAPPFSSASHTRTATHFPPASLPLRALLHRCFRALPKLSPLRGNILAVPKHRRRARLLQAGWWASVLFSAKSPPTGLPQWAFVYNCKLLIMLSSINRLQKYTTLNSSRRAVK